jgi:hypothetical protein
VSGYIIFYLQGDKQAKKMQLCEFHIAVVNSVELLPFVIEMYDVVFSVL